MDEQETGQIPGGPSKNKSNLGGEQVVSEAFPLQLHRVWKNTRHVPKRNEWVHALEQEEGVVEQTLRRLLAAYRFIARVLRAWPWGHTATAASAWFVATRTSLGKSLGTPVVPKAAISYIPGWKSLLNVTVAKAQ